MQYKKSRRNLYERNFRNFGHLINIKSPYTYLKSIFYMEAAILFLFLTQKIIKNPNVVTLLYVISGLAGVIMLNSTNILLQFFGLWLVFSRGVFDWADGTLAERLNRKSFIGYCMATYGNLITDTAFRASFLFYTLNYYPELSVLFPIGVFILLVTDFRLFSDFQYLKTMTGVGIKPGCTFRDNTFEKDVRNENISNNSLKKWYFKYIAFLDSRSRSIDSLLLILALDFSFDYDLSILLLTLSALIILRAIVMHIAGMYFSFKVYSEEVNG